MPEFTTIATNPARSLFTTLGAAGRGIPLERPLTSTERLVVALVAARPTHHWTLDSTITSRPEAARLFRLFVKRINRMKSRTRPLIYVANIARSAEGNGAGFHVHMLLWEYLHVESAARHLRELGFGWPDARQLVDHGPGSLFNYSYQIAYVLGQHEALFGSRTHERHEPLPTSQHRLLYPRPRTLQLHCPQLLSAIDLAKDQATTDETLLSALPRFSTEI